MYERGSVVKGPDLFAEHDHRPYLCVSDESHPFSDEEALYVTITTTERPVAVPLLQHDFVTGGLPRASYANPWTVASIRHADISERLGQLTEEATDSIAENVGGYIGIR
ncbi:MAG: hypothetical protein V5A27_03295 [Halapricum sp.]